MLFSSLAVLTFAASALAQGVTNLVVPSSTPPAGCENSRQGTFTITIVNVTSSDNSSSSSVIPSRRSWDRVRRNDSPNLYRRQKDGVLTLTLTGGVLHDQANRTGYIASNYQFQFDDPPQAGAIYTAGFGICANGTLSLGGSAIWWQCLSGSFYNLYDRDWTEHCVPVYFEVIEGAGVAYSTAPPASEITGAAEATISNGGGTQTSDSGPATFGGVSSVPTSNPTSGSSSSRTGSGSSASASATSSSSSASAGKLTSISQQLFAWAAGIVGAMAFVV